MMWEEKPDCYNKLVAENIRRDNVDVILKHLHFRDNSKIENDGYCKVKILLDIYLSLLHYLNCINFLNVCLFLNLKICQTFLQVCPIFDNINKASCKAFSDHGWFSVNESTIQYFGCHSSKQFIHGKPIRYGFKVKKL